MLVKHLINFLLIYLVTASSQINLHLTDWINENTDDNVLQHDCLHIALSNEIHFTHQIISYCMSEWPSKWYIERNSLDQIFTFAELYNKNITSEQLYHWSVPLDVIERYQLYLNQLSISNISSAMGRELFYNCTVPRFGPQCQYTLDIDAPSYFSLNEIIADYYRQSYETKALTCYNHLQCNRGSSLICLDWSEICDGKMDCIDGMDEKNCWPLMSNECEDDEYRCDNGQCIPKTFVNDGFDYLDRSDEFRISSMPSRYEYSMPTFENEDVICSWRGNRMNIFFNTRSLTSSCIRQHQSIMEQKMFFDVSDSISDDCLLAFKCHSNIPIYGNPLCLDLCQNETCIKIIQRYCPQIFYYPAGPIAYGHIYFVYTREYAISWKNMEQIPPEYICYNEELCGGFDSNKTLLLIDGNTCRRPKDFPVYFDISGTNWYFRFVRPLYSQFSQCSMIVPDNSMICESSTMYQCQNSSKCIPNSYVGDRIRDCNYGDDEEQTTINELCLIDRSNTFFKCGTEKKCIHRSQVENAACDCEMNEYGMCDDEDMELNDMKRKIRFSTICDGFLDLLPNTIDGRIQTDETDCKEWPCNNTNTRCDGFWNCPNGVDELNCNPSPLIICPLYHHICVSPKTNQLMCLSIDKANDGIIDCLGGLDEPTLCSAINRRSKEKKFYCKNGCISPWSLCDGYPDCENGDDEQFCNLNNNNFVLNDPSNSHTEKFFYQYFYDTLKPKPNVIISHSSVTNQSEQYCQRGLPLRVWLDSNKNLYTITCLCPSSYYGNRCQYQNQRVSLTIQFNTVSYFQRIPFVLVISLIDDSVERIIHSHQQLTYLHMKDQHTKFNVYLLYATRPKRLTRQYSVHIDIYERITLNHRGSLLIPLKFPFLPVERIAVKLNISYVNNMIANCTDHQCVHGECINYLNDPKHSFCRCEPGWTGRHCTISHMCTCSSDSLCVGVAANSRSICICPINKFGSQCLLNNNICQSTSSDRCANGGVCIPSDEYSASQHPFVCICRKGFSGERCEVIDTRMILLFDEDIVLPAQSFILLHFIHLIGNALRIHDKSPKIMCENETSLVIYWSHPFHIAFVEVPRFYYYLIIYQKIYHQSSVIITTINPLDRCLSINEIFNASLVQMHLIRCIKYYHLPCQNRSLNLSCFNDEIHMCLCQDYDDQRLANCFEFNHLTKLTDLDFDKERMEHVCALDYSFNFSNSSTPPTDSSRSSVHACEYFLYLFMLLFCLYIHYAQ